MIVPLDPGLTWPAPRTFFGAPRCDDLSTLNADVAFLGAPYDAGTLQPFIRTGQSGGPTVARASSYNQLDYSWPPSANPEGGSVGWFDVETAEASVAGIDTGIVIHENHGMRNVTVTLDEETALWARLEAARRDLSVSALLRELLRERMGGQASYAAAMDRYLSRPPARLAGRKPTREELHDRAGLR